MPSIDPGANNGVRQGLAIKACSVLVKQLFDHLEGKVGLRGPARQ